MVFLEEIDFSKLQRKKLEYRWNVDFMTERFYYIDDNYFYKIWSKKYISHLLYIYGDKYITYNFQKKEHYIASIDCGLINPETCPAFVDIILDKDGVCRGYILKKGEVLKSNEEIDAQFIDTVFKYTLMSGYAFTDFVYHNIVIIENKLSLIDLDTPPTLLKNFHVEFQIRNGCLRSHLCQKYKKLILKYLNLDEK